MKISGQQLVQMHENESQKARALEGELGQANAVLSEIEGAIKALEELKDKKNPRIMTGLGAGVMIEAIPSDTKKVHFSLPGSIAVEKTSEDAVQELEKTREDAKKQLAHLQQEHQKIIQNIGNIRKILETMQKQGQKK